MKFFLLVCLFALFELSFAASTTPAWVEHPRGCIYIDGKCSRECEEGTHAYALGCDNFTPEPSCDVPNPEVDTRSLMCDFSACYCDGPTVRDQSSGKCVPLEECPNK